ncbi:hypothetical protein [Salinarimonas ramus]|uniref:Secreted protein n=1 Tax=Salinarimonas ramus TaxID=690164 RepID=A0A917Q6V0_9HYPH|nr:hypothetical protein [Salinarimonas ramus]GGK29456.1 hypothetical protein GCM10011322_14820 [Salinarimonas ramus]
MATKTTISSGISFTRRLAPALAVVAAVTLGALAPTQVSAQANVCQSVGPLLEQRRAIVQRLESLGSENVDPRPACSALRELEANGQTLVDFIDQNQAWCQIPNDFAQNVRQDHERVGGMRADACRVAAQINNAERQAREAAESNQFGGPGLTGRFPIPQGAL